MQTRFANLGDFESIFPLLEQLYYLETIDFGRAKTLFEQELQNPFATQIVCIDENNFVVGFAYFSEKIDYQIQKNKCELNALVVNKNMRGKGYGKILIRALEQEMRKKGIEMIELVSSNKRVEAHAFYESQGYTKDAAYFWKEV